MSHSKKKQGSDLTELLLNAAGYRKSHIVLSAIQLEMFAALEKVDRATVPALAEFLRLKERSVEKLLGGLVALDLITFDGKTYANKPTARTYLLPDSRYYLGESLRTLFDIGQDTWGTLTNAIREGAPLAKQRTDEAQAKFWQDLTRAIRPFNIPVAESVAKILRWKKDSIRKVVDLGGGSGVFGEAFLKEFPNAEVIQVDWPHTNNEARKLNMAAFKEGRFKTVDGDLFECAWEKEGPFDVVIISHIIHQEGLPRISALLRRAASALRDGGEIIINEYCVNEEKNFPPYGLIFGLSMALQNTSGGVYSYSDCEKLFQEVGHEIYLACSPVPPSTVFFSRKRNQESAYKESAYKEIATPDKKSTVEAMPTSFADRRWDTVDAATREQWMLELFRKQLHFAKEHSRHWQKRIPEDILKKPSLSRSDVEALPILFKAELRLLSPYDLLGNEHTSSYIVRGSGATTGKPSTVLWSKGDWDAAVETSARFLNERRSWKGMRIWNGYNQGHVAGPVFDEIIRKVGATPIPRHFKSSDAEAIQEMEHLKVDGILLTPKSGSGKGGSLEDFLSIDPSFIERLGIKCVWVSSTNFEKSLAKELNALGVETVVNFFGSTEAMPTAISCAADPHGFHMVQGHVYMEVLDENGHHVSSGQRGTLVVSRVGSSDGSRIIPAEASQILRMVVGDSAIYDSTKCSCGLSTPKISQLQRLPKEEKVLGGCERWD